MNISFLNKNSISIKEKELYIVIDSLYLMEIKNNMSDLEKLDIREMLFKIRKEIFPYTDLPFAQYHSNSSLFNIEKIKKIDYYEALNTYQKAFSTDTGLIIFLNINIFKDFVIAFDYDALIDHHIEDINLKYWDSISEKFETNDLALVYSVEENDDIEFSGGGGDYIIE